MAHLSAFEFARTIQATCDQFDLVTSYNIQILDDLVGISILLMIPTSTSLPPKSPSLTS